VRYLHEMPTMSLQNDTSIYDKTQGSYLLDIRLQIM